MGDGRATDRLGRSLDGVGMACSEGERIMADEPREGPAEEHEPHPTGTVILMLLFIVLIIVLWGYMYLLVLGRGATQ
jgi:hypothetical protein